MAGEFLDIPGNIKQMFLPFVLNPTDNLLYDHDIKLNKLYDQYNQTKEHNDKVLEDYKNTQLNCINIQIQLQKDIPTDIYSSLRCSINGGTNKTFIDIYSKKSEYSSPVQQVLDKIFKKYSGTTGSNRKIYIQDLQDPILEFPNVNTEKLSQEDFNKLYDEARELIKSKQYPAIPSSDGIGQQYKQLSQMTSVSDFYRSKGVNTSINPYNVKVQVKTKQEYARTSTGYIIYKNKKPVYVDVPVDASIQDDVKTCIANKVAACELEKSRTIQLKEELRKLLDSSSAAVKNINAEIKEINKQNLAAIEAQENAMQSIKIQLFTFKTNSYLNTEKIPYNAAAAGFIRVLPNSFYYQWNTSAYDTDISFSRIKRTASSWDSKNDAGNTSIIEQTLNNQPSVVIREYLQDAKLNQVVNLFSEFGKAFMAQENKSQSNFLKTAFGAVVNGTKTASKLSFNIDKLVEYSFYGCLDRSSLQFKSAPDSYDDFVVRIPYMLYYMFLSFTTTNIYEIPYNGKVIYSSNGTQGWKVGHLLNGAGMNSGSSVIGGVISKIVNYIGSNIRINTTPSWEGGDGEGTSIDIEFTLFNDSLDSAVKNFIFINTIIPGNMWMQYHIFQHAPDVYDINIEGVNRFFMCAANFAIDQIGVLRKPSDEMKALLKEKHLNKRFEEKVGPVTLDDIRIPDAYNVKCTFTSLLPNNFNNYLYRYWQTEKITVPNLDTQWQESALAGVAERFGKFVATTWDSVSIGDESIQNKMKQQVFDADTSTLDGKTAMCDALDNIYKELEKKKSSGTTS